MTNKERILSVLSIMEICDDCLSDQSGVQPRQTVYTICRTLSRKSVIIRNRGKCSLCGKPKLVSQILPNQSSKKETNWYLEGNVQAIIVDYLTKNEYEIRSVSDTSSMMAITPSGNELWIRVKGYPEKSGNLQALNCFSRAVMDLVLQHGENPNIQLALALPDNFETYLNLLFRINWLKEFIPFQVFWINQEGNVRKE